MIEAGDAIRFVCNGRLGVLDPESSRPAFHPDVLIENGDEGRYVGPEQGDWHTATIERDGVTYQAPVHESMFEPMETTA